MMMNVLLVTVLAISVVTDLKERKIYNKILFPALAAAFLLQLAENGPSGLLNALIGLAAGIGILLIPYLAGGMGAGDVKLLGLVGACKGLSFLLAASVYMGLAGGVLAIAILIFRKGAVKRFKWMAYVLCGLRLGIRLPLIANRESWSAGTPYGVAIAAGAFISFWGKGWMLG